MDKQVKLLSHKTWNYVILGYILKYKYMREVVSAIDIITNLSIQEIIRKNKFQMSFLDKFLLGKALIKMMITVNN